MLITLDKRIVRISEKLGLIELEILYQTCLSRDSGNTFVENCGDFDFGDLIDSPTLLSNYDIIFLNCGLDNSKLASSNNLTQYVADGGLLYATDWAYEYLNDITADGNQYLSFYNPYKSGESLSTEAEVFNTDLLDWLTLNYNIP